MTTNGDKIDMRKNVFIKAGIITILIFIAGIAVGIWIDSSRTNDLRDRITKVDIDWNDARLQSVFYQYYSGQDGFCESAIQSNIEFSNKIYEEGVIIERYEEANRFSPYIVSEKRRYALLQLQFWLNTIELKKTCNATYSTILYMHSHYIDDTQKTQQELMSNVLVDSIHSCGEELMVAHVPIDLDIATINLIKENYGVTQTPTLIINEETILEGLQTRDTIREYIGC